jgi:DNA-binding phage protein
MTREALYKALRPGSAPSLDTIIKVMSAFGIRLVAERIPELPSDRID